MDQEKTNQYRDVLLALHNRLTEQFEHTVEAVRDMPGAPGDISHVPTHNADADTEDLLKELALGQNEETLLEEVNEALGRIDEGTFGQCANCGKPIAKARLDAIPYARRCRACAEKEERAAAHDTNKA